MTFLKALGQSLTQQKAPDTTSLSVPSDAVAVPQSNYFGAVATMAVPQLPPVVLQGNPLRRVPYADQPLAEGVIPIMLTPEELSEKLRFSYTESIHASSEIQQQLKTRLPSFRPRHNGPLESAVRTLLKTPLQDMVAVCNMGAAGHGLFAQKEIPAGTVICIYSGIIEEAGKFDAQNNTTSYDLGFMDGSNFVFRSRFAGNLARFMQFLPIDLPELKAKLKAECLRVLTGEALQKIKSNSSILDEHAEEMYASLWDDFKDITFLDSRRRSSIAKSNVSISPFIIDGIPVLACWAPDKINQYQQVGFSYNNNYWLQSFRNPMFFDNMGKIVLPCHYTTKNFSSIRPQELYVIAVDHFKKGNYSQAIIELFQAIINFMNMDRDNSKIAMCYSTLASCFREQRDLFSAIRACEQAIVIYSGLSNMHREDSEGVNVLYQELEKVKTKYIGCLKLHYPTVNADSIIKIIEHGSRLIEERNFLAAKLVFHHALEYKTDDIPEVLIARCNSKLISCE